LDGGGELGEVGELLEEAEEDVGITEADGLFEEVPGRLEVKIAAAAPAPAVPRAIRIHRL
jgi:hypothetical protein